MKSIFLVVNHAYLFFGTTLYVGVLWALHFFWYPSWSAINLGNIHDHFLLPIDEATEFFWIVVPLMLVANGIMIYFERKTRQIWPAILALICICSASYVGQELIFPINDIIAKGVENQATLNDLLKDWMFYNDVRMLIMTIMWVTLMYYFVSKGKLLQALSEERE